ncbi:hypothetical protein E0H86_08415 [Acinetobacter sp. ANC 4635]|uniref:hypothetical protein n=1 Tax=Acinetobacter sp. ANC 4635 TaxID=2529846 RepID=UPI001038DC83|nr:hypothetical protein [Acinetobacter sp. ANC 4635]TCB31685.1 hypothetical protein E0H86_08415 [Acinetobacter sp. ANC 4635]
MPSSSKLKTFAKTVMTIGSVWLGGEMAQMQLQLPVVIAGVFQGLLLMFLLAANAFIENKSHFLKKKTKAAALATQG